MRFWRAARIITPRWSVAMGVSPSLENVGCWFTVPPTERPNYADATEDDRPTAFVDGSLADWAAADRRVGRTEWLRARGDTWTGRGSQLGGNVVVIGGLVLQSCCRRGPTVQPSTRAVEGRFQAGLTCSLRAGSDGRADGVPSRTAAAGEQPTLPLEFLSTDKRDRPTDRGGRTRKPSGEGSSERASERRSGR